MKIATLFFLLLCLGGCSKDEVGETKVFPPTLIFADDYEKETVVVDDDSAEEEEIVEIQIERLQIYPELTESSSFLSPTASETYTASNTFDGSEFTVWAENAPSYGAGEWLEHQFSWPEEIQEIWIYNGHRENSGKYAQITEISLSFSTGEERVYGLNQGWNTIILDRAIYTTFVRMTILNGNTTNGSVACIAEMKLFNHSGQAATEQLGTDSILSTMGALGDCSNITPEQASAFAKELQHVIDWAETTSKERSAEFGEAYGKYTGEALLFDGGNGVPVLYYDYDFQVVDDLFVTQTDLVVWDGETATRSFFELAGQNTNINWILPGLVYEKKGEYFFGLTEYDQYGSGSFGLIALIGFDHGYPKDEADYLAFISHNSRGAYTYEAELKDYLKMPYLSSFPILQLEELVGEGADAYYEYNGNNFYQKNLSASSSNVNAWFTAIRQARIEQGYEQVTEIQSGETVLAGLLTLASGVSTQSDYNINLSQPDFEYD